MTVFRKIWSTLIVLCSATTMASIPAFAQGQKPNILFIMGDDIGWMQPSIYHRGLMVGETPNIDRIGREGGIFMDYVAMQSCTSGRNAFFTGMMTRNTYTCPPATRAAANRLMNRRISSSTCTPGPSLPLIPVCVKRLDHRDAAARREAVAVIFPTEQGLKVHRRTSRFLRLSR